MSGTKYDMLCEHGQSIKFVDKLPLMFRRGTRYWHSTYARSLVWRIEQTPRPLHPSLMTLDIPRPLFRALHAVHAQSLGT